MPEYKKFRIGKLFDIHPTKSYGLTNPKLFATRGSTPVIVNSSRDNGVGGFVALQPTEKGGIVTFSDTTTADSIFYQPNDFIGYSHVQGVYPIEPDLWSKESLLYFVVVFRKVTTGRFDYATKFNRNIALELEVSLPVTAEGGVDFPFMENRIRELERVRIRELEVYLKITGFENYKLTTAEKRFWDNRHAMEIKYAPFCLEDLFGKSTRGKRLKSLDRIDGALPFVTAGERDTGISAFIGNDVEVFSPNTITIDMFGSAKYRNYYYGADDHVAVVHTEDIEKHAVIYITAAIHKVSYNSLWNYSNNFYAKDADTLIIHLPVTSNGEPDYDYMTTFIRIQQKLAIKNVVEWKDKELAAYREVVGGGKGD